MADLSNGTIYDYIGRMKNVKTEYKKSGMKFFIERLRRCVSWEE